MELTLQSILQDITYTLKMRIHDSFASIRFNQIGSHYQVLCLGILALAVYSVYRQIR